MVRALKTVCVMVAGMSLILVPGMSSAENAATSDFVFVDGPWSIPFSYDIGEDRDVWRPEIVIDRAGDPFGVFFDTWASVSPGGYSLSYLTHTSDGGWVAGSIEGTEGVRSHSLATGDDGTIHLCFALEDEVRCFSTVGYSGVAGVLWSHEFVDEVQSDYCKVSVDGSGGVHLLYTDTSGPSLKHATRSAMEWTVATYDDIQAVDAVALGPGNVVHGFYYADEEGLVHFSDSSGEWEFQTIDSSCDAGWSLSAGVREDGTPVVVYCDDLNDNMKFAVPVSGEWVVQTLAEGVSHASMAIDKYNNTVISYISDGDVGFMLTQGGGKMWTTVQSGSRLGSPTAITTDGDGYPHMLYRYSRTIETPTETIERDCLVYATNSLSVPYGPRNVRISDEWRGLRLTWDADGGEGYSYDVTGYRVYRGIHEGDEVLLASLGADATTYLDRSVEEGTSYYYKVTSYNDEGESLLENAMSVSTEGWDWEMGLDLKDYALIVSVAAAVVLGVLFLMSRVRRKPAQADPARDVAPGRT